VRAARRRSSDGLHVGRIVPVAVALLAALLACENSDRFGPVAARCADIVRAYLAASAPVEIVGTPDQQSEGEVEISYRTTNAMNIPSEGRASCTFAVGDAGELQLVAASVDGVELSESEVAKIARSLGAGD
jgi:hypothetical protein